MYVANQKPNPTRAARGSAACAALFAALLFCLTSARADVFELASGGRVEGKLLPADENNKTNLTIELADGGHVTVSRTQVAKIDPTTEADVEYRKMSRTLPDTVEEHWKLAEWCREHKLRDERRQHLDRILELDPNHVDARNALGFHQKNGQWMNRDDVMASRGLVLFDGKYMTPQQVELMKDQKESKSTQADWVNYIQLRRRFLTGRRQDKADQARAEIQSIHDPAAANAIVAMLRGERDPGLKKLWIETAARLNSPIATNTLIDLSLFDQDEDVRHLCLDYLVKSKRSGLVTPYIHSLTDKNNDIINRAGAALGQIGERDAIGPLIEALITKHKFKVSEGNADQHAYSFSKDGSGGGGSYSMGSKPPQFVVQSMRNRAVLDSLIALSGGANFEYDQGQWRGWLAAQSKATAVDVRRDP